MTRDDEELIALRPYAAALARDVDVARLVAAVMSRVRAGESVSGFLERWMRVLTIAFAAASVLVGALFYRAEQSYVPDLATITENRLVAEADSGFH
jgi:hypothetical protein